MGIQACNGRVSDCYIGTFDYENSDDMFQLEDLRTMVKHMNRDLRTAKMTISSMSNVKVVLIQLSGLATISCQCLWMQPIVLTHTFIEGEPTNAYY